MDLANDEANHGHGGEHADMMKCFGMFGTVKEIGVDDVGLGEFHEEYYKYPLYRDDGMVLYDDFFGNRRITKLDTYNPFKLYSGYRAMTSRVKGKKLDGNLRGEGIVQGGIIVFDRDGNARYAYEEETGKELVMEDIIAALRAVHDDVK
jgi:hypothetical protein